MVKQIVPAGGLDPKEVDALLEVLDKLYGYDFQGYSKASLYRRINRLMLQRKTDIQGLQFLLLNEPGFLTHFLQEITVNVTEFFRDPEFYHAMQELVFPYLGSYPHIRAWSAGCSRGDEAYSLAILLKEHKMLNRLTLYGTDINDEVLEHARKGIFTSKDLLQARESYLKAGGQAQWADYFTLAYQSGIMDASLRERMVFSNHNLATDWVFNDFQLILCRNVLIYFDEKLQERVLRLFYESLAPFGFLCLGSREAIRFSGWKNHFKVVHPGMRIFQKIG